MTAVHLHLLVVHVPIVLCPLALVLLWVEQRRMQGPPMIAYGLLIASGVSGVVAYYSGPWAYEQLQPTLVADKAWVEQHAVLGRASFVVMVLVAALSLQAILRVLQDEPRSKVLRSAIVLGALLGTYLLAWTGHLGGQIRHVEIRHVELPIFPPLPD